MKHHKTKIKLSALFFSLIVLYFIYSKANLQKQNKSKNIVNIQEKTQSPIKPFKKTHNDKKKNMNKTTINTIPTVKATTILKTEIGSGPGEIGVQNGEGGGDGPSSYFITEDGNIYILDRNNGRLLAGVEGDLETLIKFDSNYLKGIMVDKKGNINVLEGYLDVNLHTYDKNGKKITSSQSISPLYLNGFNVRNYQDKTLLIGPAQNFSVDEKGNMTEVIGIPLDPENSFKGADHVTYQLGENGSSLNASFRDSSNRVIIEKSIAGNYDATHGTFPTSQGNTVVVVEEVMNQKDEIFTQFITYNNSGDVLSQVRTKVGGQYSMDAHYQVSEDGCTGSFMEVNHDSSEIKTIDLCH